MPLIRRCPHCQSVNVGEEKVSSMEGRGHGGRYLAVKCLDCCRVLTRFDVVDEATGELIASAAGEGDYKRVDWRKKSRDNLGRVSGRDEEGMAV